jgi:tetratricopeptide (TPR) repeat protein
LESELHQPSPKNVIALSDALIQEAKDTRTSGTRLLYHALLLREWMYSVKPGTNLRRATMRTEDLLLLAREHFELWQRLGVFTEPYHLIRSKELYQDYLKSHPHFDDTDELITYCKVLQHLGDVEGAKTVINKVLASNDQHPDYPNFLFYAGVIYKALGQCEKANNYFFEAQEVGPPKFFTKLEMMVIISRLIEEMQGEDNADDDAYKMVHAHMLLEGLTETIDYDDWISDSKTWLQLADKCAFHQMYSLATDFYGLGITRDPDAYKKPMLWYRFAKSCRRCGRVADAQLAIKQALTRSPYKRQLLEAQKFWSGNTNKFVTTVGKDFVEIFQSIPRASKVTVKAFHRLQSFVRGNAIRRQVIRGIGSRKDIKKRMFARVGILFAEKYPILIRARADWMGQLNSLLIYDVNSEVTKHIKLKYAFTPILEVGSPRKLRLHLSWERIPGKGPDQTTAHELEDDAPLDFNRDDTADDFQDKIILTMKFVDDLNKAYMQRKVVLILTENPSETLLLQNPIDETRSTKDLLKSFQNRMDGSETVGISRGKSVRRITGAIAEEEDLMDEEDLSPSPPPEFNNEETRDNQKLIAKTILKDIYINNYYEKHVETNIMVTEVTRLGLIWHEQPFLIRILNDRDVTQINIFSVKNNTNLLFLTHRENINRSVNLKKKCQKLLSFMSHHERLQRYLPSAALSKTLKDLEESHLSAADLTARQRFNFFQGKNCYIKPMPEGNGVTIILADNNTDPVIGDLYENCATVGMENTTTDKDKFTKLAIAGSLYRDSFSHAYDFSTSAKKSNKDAAKFMTTDQYLQSLDENDVESGTPRKQLQNRHHRDPLIEAINTAREVVTGRKDYVPPPREEGVVVGRTITATTTTTVEEPEKRLLLPVIQPEPEPEKMKKEEQQEQKQEQKEQEEANNQDRLSPLPNRKVEKSSSSSSLSPVPSSPSGSLVKQKSMKSVTIKSPDREESSVEEVKTPAVNVKKKKSFTGFVASPEASEISESETESPVKEVEVEKSQKKERKKRRRSVKTLPAKESKEQLSEEQMKDDNELPSKEREKEEDEDDERSLPPSIEIERESSSLSSKVPLLDLDSPAIRKSASETLPETVLEQNTMEFSSPSRQGRKSMKIVGGKVEKRSSKKRSSKNLHVDTEHQHNQQIQQQSSPVVHSPDSLLSSENRFSFNEAQQPLSREDSLGSLTREGSTITKEDSFIMEESLSPKEPKDAEKEVEPAVQVKESMKEESKPLEPEEEEPQQEEVKEKDEEIVDFELFYEQSRDKIVDAVAAEEIPSIVSESIVAVFAENKENRIYEELADLAVDSFIVSYYVDCLLLLGEREIQRVVSELNQQELELTTMSLEDDLSLQYDKFLKWRIEEERQRQEEEKKRLEEEKKRLEEEERLRIEQLRIEEEQRRIKAEQERVKRAIFLEQVAFCAEEVMLAVEESLQMKQDDFNVLSLPAPGKGESPEVQAILAALKKSQVKYFKIKSGQPLSNNNNISGSAMRSSQRNSLTPLLHKQPIKRQPLASSRAVVTGSDLLSPLTVGDLQRREMKTPFAFDSAEELKRALENIDSSSLGTGVTLSLESYISNLHKQPSWIHEHKGPKKAKKIQFSSTFNALYQNLHTNEEEQIYNKHHGTGTGEGDNPDDDSLSLAKSLSSTSWSNGKFSIEKNIVEATSIGRTANQSRSHTTSGISPSRTTRGGGGGRGGEKKSRRPGERDNSDPVGLYIQSVKQVQQLGYVPTLDHSLVGSSSSPKKPAKKPWAYAAHWQRLLADFLAAHSVGTTRPSSNPRVGTAAAADQQQQFLTLSDSEESLGSLVSLSRGGRRGGVEGGRAGGAIIEGLGGLGGLGGVSNNNNNNNNSNSNANQRPTTMTMIQRPPFWELKKKIKSLMKAISSNLQVLTANKTVALGSNPRLKSGMLSIEEMICALAETRGSVGEVITRLADHNLEFISEIQLVCSALNVRSMVCAMGPAGAELFDIELFAMNKERERENHSPSKSPTTTGEQQQPLKRRSSSGRIADLLKRERSLLLEQNQPAPPGQLSFHNDDLISVLSSDDIKGVGNTTARVLAHRTASSASLASNGSAASASQLSNPSASTAGVGKGGGGGGGITAMLARPSSLPSLRDQAGDKSHLVFPHLQISQGSPTVRNRASFVSLSSSAQRRGSAAQSSADQIAWEKIIEDQEMAMALGSALSVSSSQHSLGGGGGDSEGGGGGGPRSVTFHPFPSSSEAPPQSHPSGGGGSVMTGGGSSRSSFSSSLPGGSHHSFFTNAMKKSFRVQQQMVDELYEEHQKSQPLLAIMTRRDAIKAKQEETLLKSDKAFIREVIEKKHKLPIEGIKEHQLTTDSYDDLNNTI